MAAAAPPRTVLPDNIIKQGYLKKSIQANDLIPSASKQFANNIKQKFEPHRWYVFGVRNRRPYLEYYEKEEGIFTGNAIHTYDLSTFQNLSYTMGRTSTTFTFCIVLSDMMIDLTAPSRAHMVEWCRCLERHLRNLGIRSKIQKDDHQYTAFPVKKIPRPPAKDPPDDTADTDIGLDTNRVLNSDSESEDNEPEYEDAMFLTHDNDKDDDDDGAKALKDDETLPVRPPPRIPKRTKEEDVFGDLSTVRREEMYYNLSGHNHDLTEAEKNLFETDSDSESGDDVNNNDDDNKVKLRANIGSRLENEYTEDVGNERCVSLPIISDNRINNNNAESDSSEDDFESPSFWSMNRKSELDPEATGVQLRNTGKVKPQTTPRNCVSMAVKTSYLKHEVKEDKDSSTLKSGDTTDMNLYDIPPRSTNHAGISRKKSNDSSIVVVDHQYKCANGNSITIIDDEDSDGIGIDGKNCKFGMDDNNYETLTQKPFRENDGNCSQKTDKKTNDTEVVDSGGEIYEAAWMCNTARKRCDSDDADNDIDRCKKDLVVDLPVDSNKPKPCDKVKPSPDNEYTTSRDSYKQKGFFSRLKSRKSKSRDSKELPERLVVELTSNNSNGNTCGTECFDNEQPDGNLYSDLPTTSVEPVLDSDLCKLSLLENDIRENNEGHIALPPRQFKEQLSKSTKNHMNSGAKPKTNFMSNSVDCKSQCFGEDSYEPVDFPEAQSSRAPMPIPEKSNVRNLIDFDTHLYDETPVAPPRRKKSDKEPSGGSSPVLPPRIIRGLPSPPVRRLRNSVLESKTNEEPILPPRTNIPGTPSSPCLPPPPRPAPVSRAQSAASRLRPKSCHITGRSQSINHGPSVYVMNLKQNQVDVLKSEMESTGGLVKQISKVHFQNGLAFVECFGKIWIAGWAVRKYPKLYDKFHIGDELLSINDVQVSDLSFANKVIKNIKADTVEITIRRLPLAKVFAIQRSNEGESLGIKREGGTAEIVYVDPLGLASRHGLTSKSVTIDESGHCNWCLTEINMRALNLFYKEKEIEHRLLAVGKDISIVVQPLDFVKELKKQLKKHKSYKDYIIH
ncbi:hypothetical protein ACF0H5_009195 [Mactra antiquata]